MFSISLKFKRIEVEEEDEFASEKETNLKLAFEYVTEVIPIVTEKADKKKPRYFNVMH